MNQGNLQEKSAWRAEVLIRKMRQGDCPAILGLMQALDLAYPSMDLSLFWVVELAGEIIAAAEIREGDTWCLLSCLGVRKDLQGRGIGQALVELICRETSSSVYLYTLIPEFFRRIGFLESVCQPPSLPSRALYDCANCSLSFCHCMMRPRIDS